jgi:GNAT superfamily N-acetyltransferase
MGCRRRRSLCQHGAVLQLRRMDRADWAVVRAVRLRALADAPGAFAATLAAEEELPEEQWRRRVAESVWYVAFDDRHPIGLAGSYQVAGSNDWHLISMWVDPSARGSGVAGRLVMAVANAARRAHGARLLLWVVLGNEPALRLYRRHGFVPTGHRQPLPSDPTVTEMEMALVLDGDTPESRPASIVTDHDA